MREQQRVYEDTAETMSRRAGFLVYHCIWCRVILSTIRWLRLIGSIWMASDVLCVCTTVRQTVAATMYIGFLYCSLSMSPLHAPLLTDRAFQKGAVEEKRPNCNNLTRHLVCCVPLLRCPHVRVVLSPHSRHRFLHSPVSLFRRRCRHRCRHHGSVSVLLPRRLRRRCSRF